MKKNVIVMVCFTIFLSFCSSIRGADKMFDYISLSSMSPKELYEQVCKFDDSNNKDTAMGYYIVLAGKWRDDMSPSDKYFCTWACNELGKLWYEKGEYDKSFKFFMQGIKYGESIKGCEELLCKLYFNIGHVYCIFGDFNIGIVSFEKALSLASEYGFETGERNALRSLSTWCVSAGLKERASRYNSMLYNRFGDKDSTIVFDNYFNKSLAYMADNDVDSAAIYMKYAINYSKICSKIQPVYVASALGHLIDIYLYEKINMDSALYYLDLYSDIVYHNDIMYMKAKVMQMYSFCYNHIGKEKEANEYMLKYIVVADSILHKRQYTNLKNERFFYELDQEYNKIKDLTNAGLAKDLEIQKSRDKIVMMSVVVFLVMLFLVVLYFQNHKLKAAYKDLFIRNSENINMQQVFKNRIAELENQFNVPDNNVSDVDVVEYKAKCTDGYQNKVSDERRKHIIEGVGKIMSNAEIFCNPDFDIVKMAEMLNTNSHYVSQVINETYKKNFRMFINEFRINESQRRLLDVEKYGNYTIRAIAESVGYRSYTSFYSLFRKITGISPVMYQNMARKSVDHYCDSNMTDNDE